MLRQFDVCITHSGTAVVIVQSDLLEAMQTRVVVPLIAQGRVGRAARGLNPEIVLGDSTLVLMPQLLATMTLAELGPSAGTLAARRDDITRAMDMLLSGV